MDKEFISVGVIARPHGLRGEVRVGRAGDSLLSAARVRIGEREFNVLRVRAANDAIVLALEGIDDRNVAEALRGEEVLVKRSDLPELEDGEVYAADLVGFEVVTGDGEPIGAIDGVDNYGAGDLLRVGDRLIPLNPTTVRHVSSDERRVVVDLPDGLP